MGGEAVANTDSCADWEGGQRLIQTALDTFGELHVLVNNAGILRDRMITNMSEEEWDAVIHVHLKGHFVPLHFAAAYWRDQAKAGTPLKASVINTSSTSGCSATSARPTTARRKRASRRWRSSPRWSSTATACASTPSHPRR